MCRNCVALRARHFKIVHGEADCKFVGPPVKTPTRFVVYKKESSIPQEVMYLSTSSGTSTCAAGKWLVQKASDDDYVDAQLGYFELKGGTGGDSFFAYLVQGCSNPLCLKEKRQDLVGGLEHFLFSHILGIIIPTDFHIFQRG